MKINCNVRLVLLFLLSPFIAIAQTGIDSQDNLNQLGGQGNLIRVTLPAKEGVKGSPFLLGEFANAVPFKDGTELKNGMFNLDLEKNKLMIQSRNGISYLEQLVFDSLLFVNEARLLVNSSTLASSDYSMLEEITFSDGQVIYVGHTVQFIPANYSGAYNSGKNFDEYVKKMDFFTLKDGALEKIKFNRKWFKANYDGFNKLDETVVKNGWNYNSYDNIRLILDFVQEQ